MAGPLAPPERGRQAGLRHRRAHDLSPEPVNGCMISGLLTPAGRRDFVSPAGLLDELEAHLGTYRLRHDEKYRRGAPEPFIREQYEILENNIQAALYLMQKSPGISLCFTCSGPTGCSTSSGTCWTRLTHSTIRSSGADTAMCFLSFSSRWTKA